MNNPSPAEPVIGLICDHNSAVLAGDILRAGYRVIRVMAEDLEPDRMAEVDAWVIDCEHSHDIADAALWLEPRILALSNRPLPSDLKAYRAWCERILQILERWTAEQRHAGEAGERSDPAAWSAVKAVWVLVGSTGAFGAVKRFLGSLVDIPPVAFVYAQHIDTRQEATLLAIGRANDRIPCRLALGRHWLNPGQLLIVPASSQLSFGRKGEVHSTREPWPTAETPSINGLVLAISGIRPGGIIVFSGAGRDGSEALQTLSSMGSRIWVQEPTGCEAPSMPEAVISRGLAGAMDSPEGLARRLAELYPNSD